jgi:hypothetical protein
VICLLSVPDTIALIFSLSFVGTRHHSHILVSQLNISYAKRGILKSKCFSGFLFLTFPSGNCIFHAEKSAVLSFVGTVHHSPNFRFNQACIENIEYLADRRLDKTQILQLASCAYIQDKHNIIIKGASGNGKSYLACAFGNAACRQYYAVKYVRLPDLLEELAIARGEGIYKNVMKSYKKVELLILDEWLLTSLKENEARDLLEIVAARHQVASTIFCSQSIHRDGMKK